jgi:hypothetical protein
MSQQVGRDRRRASQVLLALAVFQAAAAAIAGLAGSMSWADVILFAAMFPVPALAVGFALQSRAAAIVSLGGGAALVVAAVAAFLAAPSPRPRRRGRHHGPHPST